MTTESWLQDEISNAVKAVELHPETVEAILVGNENLQLGVSADQILSVVRQIKSRLGSKASSVKFGTVQRITEYMDSRYDSQTRLLSDNLDILGVNIYLYFDRGCNAVKPADLLETLWNMMAAKFPVGKMLLTETGFPTAGAPSSISNVMPSLDGSVNYHKAVAQWIPKGRETSPKFWFIMCDRRPTDNSGGVELEKYFGLFTYDRQRKSSQFPQTGSSCVATGVYCGNGNDGASCCQDESYCQPWNPSYYQCIAAPARRGTQDVGIGYYGNDIASVFGVRPDQCCGKCADTPECQAYTFINYNSDGNTACYLKSAVTERRYVTGAVSSTVRSPKPACAASRSYCGNDQGVTCCPTGEYCQPWNAGYYQYVVTPAKCTTQLTNIDFYGNDITTLTSLWPGDCCTACAQTAGCKGYTFINEMPDGKTLCYLKSSFTGIRLLTGAVSGTVN